MRRPVAEMSLREVVQAARARAALERNPYEQREVPDLLDRLCDEIEARTRHERAWIKARCETAAAMRRGEAI